MSKLFIIGNGFDLAHELKTRYSDFKEYLESNYPAAEAKPEIPEGSPGRHGDIYVNPVDIVSLYLYLFEVASDENWSDLESALGKLSYEDCLSDDPVHFDDEGDPHLWKNAYVMEDATASLMDVFKRLPFFLREWIVTIDIRSCAVYQKVFHNLFHENDDYFLTFNYTETLELLYKTINVCHIHGKSDSMVFIGHGVDEFDDDYYAGRYAGSESNISGAHQVLRKDTDTAFNENSSFFYSLQNVNSIYSFGFSFSDVDMFYIEKICDIISTDNVVWYLSTYEPEDSREKFQEKILAAGFKGGFALLEL
jgi:hypothetical protein